MDDSDYLPPLIVERVSVDDEEVVLKGRRIVDMNHVLKQLEIVAMHPKHCTMGKYKLKRESISGLFCNWVYYCDNCEKDFIVTSDPLNQKDEINDALSWGAMSVGIGYSQVEELFSVLDLPIMSQRKYTAHEAEVGKVRNPIVNNDCCVMPFKLSP